MDLKASNKYFKPPIKQKNSPQSQLFANSQDINFFEPHLPLGNQFDDEDEDEDYKYFLYKQFKASGKSFDSKYPIRSHNPFKKKTRKPWNFFGGNSKDPFKAQLEKYIDKKTQLKNTIGSLSEVLRSCWKQQFQALIIILDFSPKYKEDLKSLFAQDMFVAYDLSQCFKVYGLNAAEYDLQEQLKPFFNLQKDANHFIVCRINIFEEIQVFHRIPVSTPYLQLKKRLKMAKSFCIQLEMEKRQIVKQYNEEKRGNFNYKRPKTYYKKNNKLKELQKNNNQQQQSQFFKTGEKNKSQQTRKEYQSLGKFIQQ